MNDVKKSAVLALFSIPISFIFFGMWIHGDEGFKALFVPLLMISKLVNWSESLGWVTASSGDSGNGSGLGRMMDWVIILAVQYAGYFLSLFLFFKVLSALNFPGRPPQNPAPPEKPLRMEPDRS